MEQLDRSERQTHVLPPNHKECCCSKPETVWLLRTELRPSGRRCKKADSMEGIDQENQRLNINKHMRALHSEEMFNFHQSGKMQTPKHRCLQNFSESCWWFYFYWVLTVSWGWVGWQIWALTLLIPHSCVGVLFLFLCLYSLGRCNLPLLHILDSRKDFRNSDSFVHLFSKHRLSISYV